MPFYCYVPNNESKGDGYVSEAHETRHEADCESAILGARARVLELPKPSYRHLHALKAKGWAKCEACGGVKPPWRQKVESAS